MGYYIISVWLRTTITLSRISGDIISYASSSSGRGLQSRLRRKTHECYKGGGIRGSVVCRGADDVCRKCPHLEEDICKYSEGADEGIREMDRRALGLLKIREGARIRWPEIKEKLPLIFRSWYETCCNLCGWKRTCEKNDSYLDHFRMLS